MIQDYFALQQPIVNRIVQAIEVNGKPIPIYTPASVDDMLQLTNTAPAIHVIYMDDRVEGNAGNGAASACYQQWLVVLCVKHAGAQLQTTKDLLAAASPLIIQLLKALQGFDARQPGYRPLKRVTAGATHGIKAGLGYFPYLFEAQFFL